MSSLDEKVHRIGGPAEKRGAPADKARAFDKVNARTGARKNRSVLKALEKARPQEEYFALDVSEDPDYTMVLVMKPGIDSNDYYGVNVLFYPDGKVDASTGDSLADKQWAKDKAKIIKVARKQLKTDAPMGDLDRDVRAYHGAGDGDYHGYHDKKVNESIKDLDLDLDVIRSIEHNISDLLNKNVDVEVGHVQDEGDCFKAFYVYEDPKTGKERHGSMYFTARILDHKVEDFAEKSFAGEGKLTFKQYLIWEGEDEQYTHFKQLFGAVSKKLGAHRQLLAKMQGAAAALTPLFKTNPDADALTDAMNYFATVGDLLSQNLPEKAAAAVDELKQKHGGTHSEVSKMAAAMSQAVELLKASGMNEAKQVKIKEPGWYVCDHMDKPVDGPMQERGAKEMADEMNEKHAAKHGKGDIAPYSAEYFSDYEIKRMNEAACKSDAKRLGGQDVEAIVKAKAEVAKARKAGDVAALAKAKKKLAALTEAKVFVQEPYGSGFDKKPVRKGEVLPSDDGDELEFVGVSADGKKLIMKRDGKDVEVSPSKFGAKIVEAQAELTASQKKALLADFEEWSGGFTPDDCDEAQVKKYIKVGMSSKLPQEAAIAYLKYIADNGARNAP